MYSSAFLTGRKALIGTGLGPIGTGVRTYPSTDTYLYWPSGVSGKTWPTTGDLANYNRHKEMWGARKPQMIRLYENNAQSTTGVSGSAGSYGLISSDMRAIANDGAYLNLSFKYGSAGTGWQTVANALNSATDNATKTDFRNIAQNLKRWVADTGNTAAIKKIVFGFWHEPENDGGTAAQYVAAQQAIINFLARRGVGDLGLRPPVPLDSDVTTFTDCVEWAVTLMGFQTSNFDYWPGEFATGKSYCRWMFVDPYNWGGGQSSPSMTGANVGHVPQPGDTAGDNYAKSWNPLKDPVRFVLNWSDTHPDPIIGIGEFGTSEYVDVFTGANGATITNPLKTAAKPTAKGDWYRGVARLAQGLASPTGVDPVNAFAAEPRATRIKAWLYWNDQAAMPRWLNTVPFQTGDTTGPSTTGSARSYTYDSFVAMVNDPWFNASGGGTVVNPTVSSVSATPDAATGATYTVTATGTAGSQPITSWVFDFGDGTDPVTVLGASPVTTTHTYTTEGPKTIRATASANDGGTSSRTKAVTVSFVPDTPDRLLEPLSGAPMLQQGDVVEDIRFTLNPAIEKLAQYTFARTSKRALTTISGATYTLTAADAGATLVFTNATGVTVTVPNNSTAALTPGSTVDLIQAGAGTITVVGATGVTLASPGLLTSRAQFSTIRLTQLGTLNSWVLGLDVASGVTPPPPPPPTGTTDDVINDFNNGPSGAALVTSGGVWDAQFGTTGTYVTDAVEGAYSARFNTTAQTGYYRKDFTTGQSSLWLAFYIKIAALPAASTYILQWDAGSTLKGGDLRITTAGALQVRDNVTSVITSTTTLTPGAWTRVALKLQPGGGATGSTAGHTLKTYQGVNLHTTTASSSQTAVLTQAAATTRITLGVLTAATVDYQIDRLRMNYTVEPSPAS